MKFLLLLMAVMPHIFSLEAAPRLTSSELYSYEYVEEGCGCLNGGLCFKVKYHQRKWYCKCPKGYKGKTCEFDSRATCYNGNGADYRGTVSETESGNECLDWDYPLLDFGYYSSEQAMLVQLGLDDHNYCRNPDSSRKPWCYVRKGHRFEKEFCSVPACAQELTPTCGLRDENLYKIVGGEISTIDSHPWIAAIFYRSRNREMFRCGGSLIHPCWVLTAAHCFPEGPDTKPDQYSVYLGKDALNATDSLKEQKFDVENIILHHEFDNSQGSFNNDIALVKLSGQCAVESSSVKTVCLPPTNQMLPQGSYCEIAGYGKEAQSLWYFSQYLREATVQLIPQNTCKSTQFYGSEVTDNMFCAGHPEWKVDSCKGDSGGPLVCDVYGKMFLFGIVSWGEGCAKAYRPGVYTRVTNYNQWIADNTGIVALSEGLMYPEK
ncbi:urokinase-type plasminogen activator-like [Acipenser oxyrinchus oxyrinchus]|uniref:Urokinase-type plasminogen activator n=1 Tax=Acipenser oxyrinchus oxyrinchus TaxID=40147 RepID=A0AAD8G0X4_ACIOX|nr:urokinase-type plasminogen activator-like [Acipenser oxyrinchus oxyrinchus]